MADKKIFSKEIVDTDYFADMPVSTKLLYFYLGLHTNKQGITNKPNALTRMAGCNREDLELLIKKGYVKPTEDGVKVLLE